MLCKVNDLFKVRCSKHLNVKTKWARIIDDNFDRLRMSDKGNERESGLCQYERKWEDTAVLWVCVNRKQLHCKEISNHQQINNTAEHYSGKMNVVRSIRNRRQHVKTGLNVTEWDVTDCSAAIVALVTAQWHVSLQYVRSTVFFYIYYYGTCFPAINAVATDNTTTPALLTSGHEVMISLGLLPFWTLYPFSMEEQSN